MQTVPRITIASSRSYSKHMSSFSYWSCSNLSLKCVNKFFNWRLQMISSIVNHSYQIPVWCESQFKAKIFLIANEIMETHYELKFSVRFVVLRRWKGFWYLLLSLDNQINSIHSGLIIEVELIMEIDVTICI